MDTKGLYCVTKGNISFSSLLFCFRSAAFLLWVLLLIAIFLSKLCGQPLSINRFFKSELLPQGSLFVGFLRLLQFVKSILTMVRGENVYTGRFQYEMRHFSSNVVPWYTTRSKKVGSVSEILGRTFHASGVVGWSKFTCSVNLKESTMSGLFMSHKEKISSI